MQLPSYVPVKRDSAGGSHLQILLQTGQSAVGFLSAECDEMLELLKVNF